MHISHKKKMVPRALLFLCAIFFFTPTTVFAAPTLEIGATCDRDDECKTDQCMGSTVAQYQDDFCTCNQDIHCSIFYSAYPAQTWECVKDTNEASKGLHFCQGSISGPKYPIDSSDQSPAGTVLSSSELKKFTQKPVTKIRIPGLSFSDVAVTKESGVTYFHIPFLGEYIASIYKYGIVIMSIVAVVVMIVSGLQLTMSAGNQATSESVKKRIGGAVVGLLLAVGSYTILYSVNPQLVTFNNLKIEYVETKTVMNYVGGMVQLDDLGNINLVPITDKDFHHSRPATNYEITDAMIRDIANKTQINYCILNTVIKKESGGKGLQVGHDENYPHNKRGDRCPVIGSRGRFLMTGLKKSGAKFQKIAAYDPCIHNAYSIDGKIVYNDDTLDLNNPPDYGLDWRFSHGIGLGQATIYPGKSYSRRVEGPNGPEWARQQNGRWYTVTDLLNPDKTIEATLFIVQGSMKNASGVEQFFQNYAGGPGGVPRAMQYFCDCLDKNPELTRVNACANY